MTTSYTANYSSWGALVTYTTAVGIGGLLGNGLVIFLFIYYKYLRTVTNNFIISLAVCDLMIAILDLVFSLPTVFATEWLFGPKLCAFYAFTHFYLVGVSMVMLAIIAVDRYYVIARPKFGNRINSRKFLVIIAGVYVYTMAIACPILYAPAFLQIKIYRSGCYVDFASASDFGSGSYSVVVAAFLYMAPLIIILFYYWEIFKVLRKRRNRSSLAEAENNRRRYDISRAGLGKTYTTRSMRVQLRTLRVMAALVVLFVVTWTPYTAVNLARVFSQREFFSDYVQEICILLAKSVVVANPIAYALVNHRFQKCIVKLFCCTVVSMGGTTTDNSLEIHGSARGSRTPTINTRSPRLSRQHNPRESSTAEVSTPNILSLPYFSNDNRVSRPGERRQPKLGERGLWEKRGPWEKKESGDKRGSEDKRRPKWNSANNVQRLHFDSSTADRTKWYITVTTF